MRFKSRSRALAAAALSASVGLAGLTLAASPAQAEPADIVRVAGATRYGTAAAAADRAYPDGATNVVLASGEDFPDALSAGGFAGSLGAPILLTPQDRLDDATLAGLGSLGAETVYVMGGTAAVSDDVVEALEAEGYTVVRVAGDDRFETAAETAAEIGGTTAVLANGFSFADALAISPGAHALELPLVLTETDDLPASSAAFLDGVDTVVIVGGTAVVSQEIEDALEADGKTVVRLAGATRYESAVEIAEFHFDNGFDDDELVMATGENFADALAGGPLASQLNAPLVLTQTNVLTPATQTFIESIAPALDTIYILGGTAAISDDVANAAAAAADEGTNQSFTVTPSDTGSLTRVANPDATPVDDRQYTVTGLDSARTYTVALFSSADVQVDTDGVVTFDDAGGDNLADRTVPTADITVVNGAAQAANTSLVTVSPVGGTINFTVDGDAANETVVPVIWLDTTANGQLNLAAPVTANTNPKAPAESFGIGGPVTYLPPAATTGDIGAADIEITAVDKAADTITTAAASYMYDANDNYYVISADAADVDPLSETNRVTLEGFEAQLSAGDELDSRTFYQATAALPSTFVLEDITPLAPTGLSVTPSTTTAVVTVDSASVTPGATVTAKVVANGAACTATAVTTASATADADAGTAGYQISVTGLTADTDYEVCVFQTVGGETSGFVGPAALNTLAVGETVRPTIVNTEITADTDVLGLVDDGDTLVIDFSEAMAAALETSASDFIRLSDGDSTYQIASGAAGANFALSDGPGSTGVSDRLTVTVPALTLISGTANGLDYAGGTVTITLLSGGFDDVAGNQVDLAASSDVVVDDE